MVKLIFERTFKPGYNSKLKLNTFSDYYSRLPNNTTTYVKVINFANDVSIMNVTGIELSENLHDAESLTEKNPGQINILYSSKDGLKPCTAKQFATWCKKCVDQIKDVDPELINVRIRDKDDPFRYDRFRFYYDDETSTAIIACNVGNAHTIANYIQSHIDDFKKAAKTTKTLKLNDKPKA